MTIMIYWKPSESIIIIFQAWNISFTLKNHWETFYKYFLLFLQTLWEFFLFSWRFWYFLVYKDWLWALLQMGDSTPTQCWGSIVTGRRFWFKTQFYDLSQSMIQIGKYFISIFLHFIFSEAAGLFMLASWNGSDCITNCQYLQCHKQLFYHGPHQTRSNRDGLGENVRWKL